MKKDLETGMFSFEQVNANQIRNLFSSDSFFWLTTAMAIAFAVQEMQGASEEKEQPTQEIVDLFNNAIRSGNSDAYLTRAKEFGLERVRVMHNKNCEVSSFDVSICLAISKSFTTYWLMYNLIELQWQEVLGEEAQTETYQLLDGVLSEREELEDITKSYMENGVISKDQEIFLMEHWQHAKIFWGNLYASLNLHAMGL